MPTQNRRMGQFSEKEDEGLYEQAVERASDVYRETEGLVRRNPGSSSLVTFGVGFGIGLMMTHLLVAPKRRRSWYENYIPDTSNLASNLPSRDQIVDTIARLLPDALARRM